MRPALYGVMCGLAVALFGCGEAPPPAHELEDRQIKAQQQADQDERQMRKERQKKPPK